MPNGRRNATTSHDHSTMHEDAAHTRMQHSRGCTRMHEDARGRSMHPAMRCSSQPAMRCSSQPAMRYNTHAAMRCSTHAAMRCSTHAAMRHPDEMRGAARCNAMQYTRCNAGCSVAMRHPKQLLVCPQHVTGACLVRTQIELRALFLQLAPCSLPMRILVTQPANVYTCRAACHCVYLTRSLPSCTFGMHTTN